MHRLFAALTVLALALLAACDSPSVAFMGSPKTPVVIEGSRFSIFRREDRVEVYRTSFEMLPPRAQVLRRAELAIEQATGCKVWSGTLKGDQALIKARLACGAQSTPPPPVTTGFYYECEVFDSWDIVSRNQTVEAIECELVPE